MIAYFANRSRRLRAGGWLGLLVAAAALLAACNSGPSTQHPANTAKTAQIDPSTAETVTGPPVIATEVHPETQGPVKELTVVPRKTEIIYVCVPVSVAWDDEFTVKWYQNGKHMAHLDSHFEPSDVSFDGWIAFPFKSNEPWPTGNYTIEFYYFNKLAGVTNFQIK